MESAPTTIASFVVAFSEDRSRILLVKHSYNNNQWSLPGGGLESGEDAIAAGKREFNEETGLWCDIHWEHLVGTFFLRKSAGVVFLFVGTVTGGEKNGVTDETLCAEFVPLASLADMDVYPAQRAFIDRALAWAPGDAPLFNHP